MFVLCALGCSYARDDPVGENSEDIAQHGCRYLHSAKSLVDPYYARESLASVQSLLLICIYNMNCLELSQCYSQIGTCLRMALRMRLHEKVDGHLSPIERESRKRLFWTLYQFDRYVSVLLDLPFAIRDEEIGQDEPEEVDDIYICETGIERQPSGLPSLLSGFNAYTRFGSGHLPIRPL